MPYERVSIAGRALDINDSGEICGYQDLLGHAEPNRAPCVRVPNESGGYGNWTNLPVPHDAMGGCAIAINSGATVVGYYDDAEDRSTVCYWIRKDSEFQFVDLETAGVARGINDLGIIVGGSDVSSYLWQSGGRFDLSEIEGGPKQSRALGITFSGDVVVREEDGSQSTYSPQTGVPPRKWTWNG